MKKCLSLAVLLATSLMHRYTFCQIAYHDAMALSAYVDSNGRLIRIKEDEYVKILKKYLPKELSGINNEAVIELYNQNPFFMKFIGPEGAASGETRVEAAPPNKPGLFGGLTAATFADGLARFLVERSKEELNVAFFQKIKDELGKEENKSLRILFPTTYGFIQQIEAYNYAAMIQILKEAFQEDLKNLIFNFEKLFELEEYRKVPELTFFVAGIKVVHSMANGNPPTEVIKNISQWEELKNKNSDLYYSFKLAEIFSESLRDTAATGGWVEGNRLLKLFGDAHQHAFRIYLGLIYQQSDGITFSNGKTFRDLLCEGKENLSVFENLVRGFIARVDAVGQAVSDIKDKNKRNDKPLYEAHYRFFISMLDFIEYGWGLADNLTKSNSMKNEAVKRYFMLARGAGEVYKNINELNYSSAIMNVVIMYDFAFALAPGKKDSIIKNLDEQIKRFDGQIKSARDSLIKKNLQAEKSKAESEKNTFEKLETIKSLILKYGAFMAAVAQAQNSNDVKNAIEAVVLPVGSASIKKNSSFNVALNAYLGGFYGQEILQNLDDEKRDNIFGITAPIGITASLSKGLNCIGVGSYSLYVTALDLGAITAYRIKDDTTASLPEFKFRNIVAPGIYLVLGFKDAPISFGGGWQIGPQLRKITNTTAEINQYRGQRWSLFLAVDIPLQNFYTKPK